MQLKKEINSSLQNKSLNLMKMLLVSSLIYFALQQIVLYFGGIWEFSLHYQNLGETTELTKVLFCLAILLALIVGVICLFRSIKMLKIGEILLFSMLFLSGIYWTCLSMQEVSISEAFFSNGAPAILLFPVLFFVGLEEDLWNTTVKVSRATSLIFLILSLYEGIKFSLMFGFGSRLGASPTMTYFIIGFWMLVVSMFDTRNNAKNYVVLDYLCIMLVFIIAILLVSRSWIIQGLILTIGYIFKTKQQNVKRNRGVKILMIIAMVIFSVIVAKVFLTDATGSLIDRMYESTRSNQYKIFFSQVTIGELFKGRGINASYSFIGINDYKYFDNQFIFLMFRYGFIPVIMYFLLMFLPIIRATKKLHRDTTKYIALGLCQWLLALSGLAIYINVAFNIPNMMIWIMCGRCYYLQRLNDRLQTPYIT